MGRVRVIELSALTAAHKRGMRQRLVPGSVNLRYITFSLKSHGSLQTRAWLAFGVAIFVLGASPKAVNSPSRMNAGIFPLLARPGVPISLDQIEERLLKQGGPSSNEIIKSKFYRDTSGRVRMEGSTSVVLIDPVVGSKVVLLSSQHVAYRMPYPRSSEVKFAFLGIAGEVASARKLTGTVESLGKRTIEGMEFEGTRIIQAAEGEPELTWTIEEWYSDEMKLIGFAATSGPQETYTARIQNLRREEPNGTLFAIPLDYEIVDLQLPEGQSQR